MIPLDDCCYRCEGPCNLVVCRDQAPSPGETRHVCADCHDTETALRYGLTQPNTDPHTWNGTAA